MKNENEKKIFRMCQAYGVSKEYELAQKLGVEANTVSGWKNRGVPKGRILKTSHDTGFAIKYLETGEGEMLVKPKPTTSEPGKPYSQSGDKRKMEAIFTEEEYNSVERVIQMIKSKSPVGQELKKEINKYFYKWVDEEKRRMENEGNKGGSTSNNQ